MCLPDFTGLCDFQFLPMLQDDKGVMRDVTRSLLPLKIDGDNFKNWIDEPAEYFLPPAVFCRIDSQSLNVSRFMLDYITQIFFRLGRARGKNVCPIRPVPDWLRTTPSQFNPSHGFDLLGISSYWSGAVEDSPDRVDPE